MAAENLKLALIQSNLFWEDKKRNLDMFRDKIMSINFQSDIVILPEMFNTGFTMNAREMGESMSEVTLEWMKEVSSASGKVITGSFIATENDRHYNRLVWMRPDGSFEYYDKKHLFRMAGEDAHFSAGEANILIEHKGWKIRPLICYDLRFPVWSRNKHVIENGKAKPAYDVVIYVANWPAVRSLPWDILLRARAVENQVYCIGLNRIGKDGNNKEYNGHSAVINARGEYLLNPADDIDEIFRVELDYEALQYFREKFPQGLDADNFELT